MLSFFLAVYHVVQDMSEVPTVLVYNGAANPYEASPLIIPAIRKKV